MRNLLILFLIVTGFAVIGCKSAHKSAHQNLNLNKLSKAEIKAYNNDPNNKDKIVCKKEKPVGSNIPEKVCYKKSDIIKRSQADQQTWKDEVLAGSN